MSDIGPFEALMFLCSYEERKKEMIDPKKLESGELKLSDLLTEENFTMACSVSIVSLIYLSFLHLLLFMTHYPNIMVQLQLQAKKTDRVKAAEASSRYYWITPPRRQLHLSRQPKQSMMVCTPTHTQVQWLPDPFLINYLSLF